MPSSRLTSPPDHISDGLRRGLLAPPGEVLQVARSIGGTVVDLHHVDPNPARRSGPAPRTLAIVGALCLFAATLAFARGVSVSADNQRALTEATAAGTASDFRPRRLGIGHDFIAFGGLFGGILCIGAALAGARRPRPRTGLTIGESDEADLAWDGVVLADLVSSDGAGLSIEVPAGADAVLHIDDLEAEVEGAVTLPAGDKLKIDRGPETLHFEWVPRPASGQLAAAAQIDERTLAYAGATAGAFALFLALIWNMPPTAGSLSSDNINGEGRLEYISLAPPDDHLMHEPDRDDGDSSGDPSTGEPASAGLEGDTGKPDETATTGRAKIAKVADADPSVARRTEMTPSQARNAGILGILSANRDYISHFSSTADFTNGLDETTIIGGMDGTEYNARNGVWDRGWGGRTRFSSSPYAADWGTTKVGLLPTGPGDRGDEYSPFGGDGRRMRDHRAKTPVVKIDAPKSVCSVAGCDKQLIRRYIKKHHARFRYCYEKALVRKPNLAGTVRTNFLISGTGKVQGADASGIGDGELEGCVANVLASIKFPVVADGDMVSVKYPFHFQHIGR